MLTIANALRLLAAVGLWASCFPLIARGLGLAPHLAFATLRAALAGLCLLVLGVLLRRSPPKGVRAWSLIVLTGVSATSLGFLGMFHAAEFVSPGVATIVFNAQPLAAAVLAHLFLKERLPATGLIGLAFGFLGVLAVSWTNLSDGSGRYLKGLAYVAAAALGAAVGNVTMKRLSEDADAIWAVGLSLTLGAGPLAVASILTEDLTFPWSGEFILILALLSVFGTAVAFWLWFSALKKVELGAANAFTFLVPLLGLAMGAWFYGEETGWREVLGAALVLTGVAFAQRRAGGSDEGSGMKPRNAA